MAVDPNRGSRKARCRRAWVRRAQHLLVLLAAVAPPAVAGCSPVHSALRPPYLLDGRWYSEAELGQEAILRCLSGGRVPTALPPLPFSTDGCTLAPGGRNTDCCIEHDMAYWCGGAAELRAIADERLRLCVRARSGPLAATAAYLGVRVGGSRWLPFPWRWGYGFPWLHDDRRTSPRTSGTDAAISSSPPSR